MRARGAVYIGWIAAEREGSGDVGRFLNALPGDEIIRVANVLSSRLAGMLERRGFVRKTERTRSGEEVDVWERRRLNRGQDVGNPRVAEGS